MTLTEYFTEAMKLEDGDTLLIPCTDEREQESTRVRMYTLRRINRQTGLEISKQKMDENFFVAVKRRSEYASGCIIKADGTTVQLKEKAPEATTLKRMVSMALKDGLSESEIIDQFQPSFPVSDIIEVLKEIDYEDQSKNDQA